MYLTMLGLAPTDGHSGSPSAAGADGSAHGRGGATPPSRTSGSPLAPRRGRHAAATMAATAIGAKMARREQDLSMAASKLAPVQRLHRAAPEERPPQPVAALPSTLPQGHTNDLEDTQEAVAVESGAHAIGGHPAAQDPDRSGRGPRVALTEYADVADLPFVPTVAKRGNPLAGSDSDGASSLAPPGTSRAVMEIKEDGSRVLSAQQAAAAPLAAARSARDAFSLTSGTPEGSTGTAQRNPLSGRTPPGTVGDGDSAPFLCSSPRGAEQLFLHKSPSHRPAGSGIRAAPDALSAARQSYAIEHSGRAALARRSGTATAPPPASGASGVTAASAATEPADLAAAAAALQPAPPRNGLQPQPVSRPAPGSGGNPQILYGKLTAPPSASPSSPVHRQSSAASASTSASSGHKLPAFRLRPPPPPAPASPARRAGSRTSSRKLQALEDLSQKLGSVSVSGSGMSGAATSANGAMAGNRATGASVVGEPQGKPRVQPPPVGCSLSSIFCRGAQPLD